MKRLLLAVTAALALSAALTAAPAGAAFGLQTFEMAVEEEGGGGAQSAGTHPFALVTSLAVNTREDAVLGVTPDEEVRDLHIALPEGLVGDPGATERCSTADFLSKTFGDAQTARSSLCPDESAVGTIAAAAEAPDSYVMAPIFNLEATPGLAARFGFVVLGVPVLIEARLSDSPPYRVVTSATSVSQTLRFYGAEVTFWGDPSDPAHDPVRGSCVAIFDMGPDPAIPSRGTCPVDRTERPLLTLPRSCTGPLAGAFSLDSWQNPGRFVGAGFGVRERTPPGAPIAMNGCELLEFGPTVDARLTTAAASSPSGLDFGLDVDDPGLSDAKGTAMSDIKRAVVTMPEGFTVNPSAAEGLVGCSPGQLAAETLGSPPGAGCPEAAKLGGLEAESPLLEGELLRGSLFIATQDDPATAAPGAENPLDTMIALYMVIKHPERGVLVKLAGKVEPDPQTGRLTTTFDGLPQLPISSFRLHFRGGSRAPLATPPRCGEFAVRTVLTPWSDPAREVVTTTPLQVSEGAAGASCPAGQAPFEPGFEAGSLDNRAGTHTPFYMRLTRRDGDRQITRFSSLLPPGLLGKLAGVGKCPDAAIAAARGKSGRQELAAASCPASSQIGRVLGGAGVGPDLTFVPGKIYLAGPFAGAPLSVVVITPAVAGPIDAGSVVVREALDVNPDTAEVQIDGARSDPIPTILAGIPLHLRDLRVFVDRDRFILNPTRCDPFEVRASLFGGLLETPGATEVSAARSARFQAAGCARLKFKPKLSLRLKGGTRRGTHPALRAVVRARPGDANFGRAVVTLPHSAFLEQSHIRTICTRVQFAANTCPEGSVYGRARATTPLLDEPLEGPVYLRSSSNPLPDLVVALRGVVDVNLVGRIDSVDAQIRTTFASIPDAPVTKFVLDMRGGKKGLIVNSRNLCARPSRAVAKLRGQNGRALDLRPVVRSSSCKIKKSRKPSSGR